MDPNATLEELRGLFHDWQASSYYDMAKIVSSFDRASELFTVLDQWLSNNGFMPEDWELHK